MTELSKSELRAILCLRRGSLSARAQTTARAEVTNRATSLPQWNTAQRIAIYHSMEGEIETGDIIERCHTEEKQVYLPVIGTGRDMVFAHCGPNDELLQNSFGIYEPSPNATRCAVAELDILFMPLVGWDRSGGRLGMGAGYYDRALADVTGPLLVGLAHQIQEVNRVPRDSWDIPLDIIITDTKVYHCRK